MPDLSSLPAVPTGCAGACTMDVSSWEAVFAPEAASVDANHMRDAQCALLGQGLLADSRGARGRGRGLQNHGQRRAARAAAEPGMPPCPKLPADADNKHCLSGVMLLIDVPDQTQPAVR